jgi:hypothetical protein
MVGRKAQVHVSICLYLVTFIAPLPLYNLPICVAALFIIVYMQFKSIDRAGSLILAFSISQLWIRRTTGRCLRCLCQWLVERFGQNGHRSCKSILLYLLCHLFVSADINDVLHNIQEIDIAAASLSVTYPRSLVVDFTFAFSEDPTSILIPYPRLDSTISGIIKPFQYEVLWNYS